MFVLLLLFSFGTGFVHELAHMVAARAVGVKSRIGLSHRLWFLVFETDLSGIWAIPRAQRYLPLLAGPLIDVTSAALLLILLGSNSLAGLGFPSQVVNGLKAMALIYMIRLLWQCYFFLRTDLYYLVALALGCKNLMQDTETMLRNQWARLSARGEVTDQSHIPKTELRVIRLYTVPWVLGRLLALYVLGAIQLPTLFSYFVTAFDNLDGGYRQDTYAFLDSLVVALLGTAILGTGLYLWIKGLLSHWRQNHAVSS